MAIHLEPLNMHGHTNTWEEELQEVARERDELRAEVERLKTALRNLLAYTVNMNVYTDRSTTIHEAEDALDDQS